MKFVHPAKSQLHHDFVRGRASFVFAISLARNPKFHDIYTQDMSFLLCEVSLSNENKRVWRVRVLCGGGGHSQTFWRNKHLNTVDSALIWRSLWLEKSLEITSTFLEFWIYPDSCLSAWLQQAAACSAMLAADRSWREIYFTSCYREERGKKRDRTVTHRYKQPLCVLAACYLTANVL